MKIISNIVEVSNGINADILDSVFIKNSRTNNMEAEILDLKETTTHSSCLVTDDTKIVQNGLTNGFVEKKSLTNGANDFDEISDDDFQLVLESSDDEIKLDGVGSSENKSKVELVSKSEKNVSKFSLKITIDEDKEISEIDNNGPKSKDKVDIANSVTVEGTCSLDTLLDCDDLTNKGKNSLGNSDANKDFVSETNVCKNIGSSLKNKNEVVTVSNKYNSLEAINEKKPEKSNGLINSKLIENYDVNSKLDKENEKTSRPSSLLEENLGNILDEDSLVLEISNEINNYEHSKSNSNEDSSCLNKFSPDNDCAASFNCETTDIVVESSTASLETEKKTSNSDLPLDVKPINDSKRGESESLKNRSQQSIELDDNCAVESDSNIVSTKNEENANSIVEVEDNFDDITNWIVIDEVKNSEDTDCKSDSDFLSQSTDDEIKHAEVNRTDRNETLISNERIELNKGENVSSNLTIGGEPVLNAVTSKENSVDVFRDDVDSAKEIEDKEMIDTNQEKDSQKMSEVDDIIVEDSTPKYVVSRSEQKSVIEIKDEDKVGNILEPSVLLNVESKVSEKEINQVAEAVTLSKADEAAESIEEVSPEEVMLPSLSSGEITSVKTESLQSRDNKPLDSITLSSEDALLSLPKQEEMTESIELPREDIEIKSEDEVTEVVDLPSEEVKLSQVTNSEITESVEMSQVIEDETTESIDMPNEETKLPLTTTTETLSSVTNMDVTDSIEDCKLSLTTNEVTEPSDLGNDAGSSSTTDIKVAECTDLPNESVRLSLTEEDTLQLKMDIDESFTEKKNIPVEELSDVMDETPELSKNADSKHTDLQTTKTITDDGEDFVKSEEEETDSVSASILEEIASKIESDSTQILQVTAEDVKTTSDSCTEINSDMKQNEKTDQSNKDIHKCANDSALSAISAVTNSDVTAKETSLPTRKRSCSEIETESDTKKVKHIEEEIKITDCKTTNESEPEIISAVSTLKRGSESTECEKDVKRPKLSDDDGSSVCSQVVEDCLQLAEKENLESKDTDESSDSKSTKGSCGKKSKKKSLSSKPTNLDIAIDNVAKNYIEKPGFKIPVLKQFHKEKLTNLTRNDLEELVVLKMCEAFADRSTIGELRIRCNKIEQNSEMWRKKATQLEKSIRDLDLVLKRYLSEVNSSKKERTPVPIKVTRSVGLQVSLTTLSGSRKASNEARKSANADRKSVYIPSPKPQSLPMPVKNKPSTSTNTSPMKITPQPQSGSIKTMLPRKSLDISSPAKAPVRSRSSTPASLPPNASPKNNSLEVIDLTDKDDRGRKIVQQKQPPQQPPVQQPQQRQKVIYQPKPPQIQQRPAVQQNQAKKVVQQNQMRPQLPQQQQQQQVQKVHKALPMQQTRTQPNGQPTTRFASTAQNNLRFVQAQLANNNNMAILVPTSVASNGNQRPQHLIIAATSPPNQLRSSTMGVVTTRPRNTSPAINVNGNNSVMIRTSQVLPIHQANQVIRTTPASIPIITTSAVPQIRPNLPVFKHPAPLPSNPTHPAKAGVKLPPPKPQLKIAKTANGIMLSWSMSIGSDVADIASYQLFAYQEGSHPPNTALWKKVGDVKALPLPMACTLTQFLEGHKYHFSVRAVDIHSRIGPFSVPGSIVLSTSK